MAKKKSTAKAGAPKKAITGGAPKKTDRPAWQTQYDPGRWLHVAFWYASDALVFTDDEDQTEEEAQQTWGRMLEAKLRLQDWLDAFHEDILATYPPHHPTFKFGDYESGSATGALMRFLAESAYEWTKSLIESTVVNGVRIVDAQWLDRSAAFIRSIGRDRRSRELALRTHHDACLREVGAVEKLLERFASIDAIVERIGKGKRTAERMAEKAFRDPEGRYVILKSELSK